MEWHGTAVTIMERLEWTDRYRYINQNNRAWDRDDRKPQAERPTTGKMVN